jgi:UDP-glucose 4-epimerase
VQRNDARQITVNVQGSLRLFELARAAGCERFVGLGSQAEYGNYDIPLQEDLTAHPLTAYGVAKLATCLLLQKLAELDAVRFVWLRLLSTYGPDDDEGHMIPTLIRELCEGAVPQLTLGEQVWDYLYIDDAVDAICAAAVSANTAGVYNLGSGKPCTIREVAERVRDLVDPTRSLGLGMVPYRPDQVMYLLGDARKLREATGWAPRVSLEEGLARTVDWYRSQATWER